MASADANRLANRDQPASQNVHVCVPRAGEQQPGERSPEPRRGELALRLSRNLLERPEEDVSRAFGAYLRQGSQPDVRTAGFTPWGRRDQLVDNRSAPRAVFAKPPEAGKTSPMSAREASIGW
jgi:hypothetical protein